MTSHAWYTHLACTFDVDQPHLVELHVRDEVTFTADLDRPSCRTSSGPRRPLRFSA